MHKIELTWKAFSVDLDKINRHFRSVLSSNYDGLLCNSEGASVVFLEEPIQGDTDLVNTYWDNAQASDFLPTPQEVVSKLIDNAQIFGTHILSQFATENVLMGITQAGKTIQVTNYLHRLSHYVNTGSLYAAVAEIDTIIADSSPEKAALAPFITNDRMSLYRSKITAYLGI